MVIIRDVCKQGVYKMFSARKSKVLACAGFVGKKHALMETKTA